MKRQNAMQSTVEYQVKTRMGKRQQKRERERDTLCLSNVITASNSNFPKSWLLLLKMVDRDQTNMKLAKKNTFGGARVPRGLFWGDFMVLQQKSLKISILRALKLIFFVNILYWHHKCIYQVVKYILGGQGAPRELFLRKFDGAATKNH